MSKCVFDIDIDSYLSVSIAIDINSVNGVYPDNARLRVYVHTLNPHDLSQLDPQPF